LSELQLKVVATQGTGIHARTERVTGFSVFGAARAMEALWTDPASLGLSIPLLPGNNLSLSILLFLFMKRPFFER
jgi:hypothetical protein